MIDNPADALREEIAELKRRLRELETHAALTNSSISSGPGLEVLVPEGIRHKDGGSTTAGAAEITSRDGGKVGAGGTWTRSDGKIGRDDGGEVAFTDDAAVGGKLVVLGSVDGRGGVWTPWEGAKATVESIMGGIKSLAQGAASAASAAAGAASAARARADAAYDLANSKIGSGDFQTLQGQVATLSALLADLRAGVNRHYDSFHGGWRPPNPNG